MTLCRRLRRHAPVVALVAVLAVCTAGAAFAATASSRPKLGGTWSGRYGGAFSGTFKLHWRQTGTKLTGTIALSRPRGTYGITGSVRGTAIKFGAVAVGATYSGSVSGASMSGHYRTPQGGGAWSAHKTS